MQLTAPNVRAAAKRVLSLLLLLFAVILTFRTSWIISETLLDSDAAANMILGEKLAREGGILSSTFRYGTELYVADMQIIYSLLFRICGDWSLVRFWGAALMQLLMLAAYGLLARQSRMSFNMFCVTGAALLLPFSVPYGRIVVFHNYYTPHVTLDFLMIGLLLGVRRRTEEKAAWWKIALWGGGLAVTGFVSGLAGVRQLMICAAPAMTAAVLCAAWDRKDSALKEELPSLIWAAALLIAVLGGYLVNSRVLSEIYAFNSYDDQLLLLAEPEKRQIVLEGFLMSVGYENDIDLFTLQGMLSVASVAATLIALLLAAFTFFRSENRNARFVSAFLLSSLAVITCVFCFLSSQEFRIELYYLPVIAWMLPALGLADARKAEPEPMTLRGLAGLESSPLSARRLTALAACALLIANGVFYTGFFRDPMASEGSIRYTGLNVEDTQTVEVLAPIADYLKENGYTLCYADYWNGGVITELTDGQVKSVSVEPTGRKKPLRYFAWMADQNLWDAGFAAEQKACILSDANSIGPYMDDILEKIEGLEERESFLSYTVWELTDPAAVARSLE